LLVEVSSMLATDTARQEVIWSRSRLQGITALRASNLEQSVLAKSGDNLRIDWGYVFLAIPDQPGTTAATEFHDAALSAFASGKPLSTDTMDMPQPARRAALLATAFDLGQVSTASVSRYILLGYDDLYSIEYLNRWMRPYWRRNQMNIGE